MKAWAVPNSGIMLTFSRRLLFVGTIMRGKAIKVTVFAITVMFSSFEAKYGGELATSLGPV